MTPDAEFNDIAGGDPRLAELLRTSLERLQNGVAGPALQEMARDVLTGRISLRAATALNYYQDALTGHLDRFQQWRAETDPAVMREAVDAAEQALNGDSRATQQT